jgi:hypothetical protein
MSRKTRFGIVVAVVVLAYATMFQIAFGADSGLDSASAWPSGLAGDESPPRPAQNVPFSLSVAP